MNISCLRPHPSKLQDFPRPLTYISRLSRTKIISQHFPGPGNFTKKIPRLSRMRGNPVDTTAEVPVERMTEARAIIRSPYALSPYTYQSEAWLVAV